MIDADDIKIRFILEPENQARHLFHNAADDFELRLERKILKRFLVVNEHGKALVRGVVVVQLREHGNVVPAARRRVLRKNGGKAEGDSS